MRWRTSSRCASGSCVAASFATDAVFVRDTKADDGPALRFSTAEWKTFVSGVKQGDFRAS